MPCLRTCPRRRPKAIRSPWCQRRSAQEKSCLRTQWSGRPTAQARVFRVALYQWAVAHWEHYLALIKFAALKPGQLVLAPGIAGAVGPETIQIARRLGASLAISTASTTRKAEQARAAGYGHVIDLSREALADGVRRITNGKGVDVVVDSVGGAVTWPALASLAFGGTSVSGPGALLQLLASQAAIVTNGEACVRLLAGDPPNLEETRQAVGCMIRDGHRASEVIRRMRALVKRTPPRQEWLDVNALILEVLALTRSEVHRHRVALQTHLATDLPRVLGDRIQVQQVLLNLIVNAIDAMKGVPEEGRALQISSGTHEPYAVLVAVRDAGIGLAAESLDHLFDAFYTTKPEGLGMGLAISRTIIEAHGGRL